VDRHRHSPLGFRTVSHWHSSVGADQGATRVRSGHHWSFLLRPPSEAVSSIPFAAVQGRYRRTAKMARVEAALLIADQPLSPRRLVQLAMLVDVAEARQLVEELNAAYDGSHSAFRIERVATGYRLLTRPELSLWLGKLHQREAQQKLTQPALETLTILAYRQPMTRADLEQLRGVQCTDLLRMLMDRGLIRIAGEEQTLGRPFLYETTRKFLELYGLRSLNDLPQAAQLRRVRTSETDPSEDADPAAAEAA
jgi:segregation and condensation protein B